MLRVPPRVVQLDLIDGHRWSAARLGHFGYMARHSAAWHGRGSAYRLVPDAPLFANQPAAADASYKKAFGDTHALLIRGVEFFKTARRWH